MHKKRFWITSCILAAGFTMNMAGAVGAADAEKERFGGAYYSGFAR